jgi:hypothetical protein
MAFKIIFPLEIYFKLCAQNNVLKYKGTVRSNVTLQRKKVSDQPEISLSATMKYKLYSKMTPPSFKQHVIGVKS